MIQHSRETNIASAKSPNQPVLLIQIWKSESNFFFRDKITAKKKNICRKKSNFFSNRILKKRVTVRNMTGITRECNNHFGPFTNIPKNFRHSYQ